MAMWKDSGSGDFTPPPAGTHVARCVRVLDIGTHSSEYQGQKSTKRQSVVSWELPSELIQGGEYDGQPYIVSKFYTASLNEKANLRKDLENWRGRAFTDRELDGFDPRNILGIPCLVTVVHNDKGRAKVTGVTSVPKGMQVPAQVNPTIFFDLDTFDQKVFDALPKGFKKMIEESPEYQAILKHAARNGGGGPPSGDPYGQEWEPGDGPADEPDSEIPF